MELDILQLWIPRFLPFSQLAFLASCYSLFDRHVKTLAVSERIGPVRAGALYIISRKYNMVSLLNCTLVFGDTILRLLLPSTFLEQRSRY